MNAAAWLAFVLFVSSLLIALGPFACYFAYGLGGRNEARRNLREYLYARQRCAELEAALEDVRFALHHGDTPDAYATISWTIGGVKRSRVDSALLRKALEILAEVRRAGGATATTILRIDALRSEVEAELGMKP